MIAGTWYTDPANVADLIRYLRAQDLAFDLDNALGVLDRPHRWTREYEAMRRHDGDEMAAELEASIAVARCREAGAVR